jgi:hypothetical protein
MSLAESVSPTLEHIVDSKDSWDYCNSYQEVVSSDENLQF